MRTLMFLLVALFAFVVWDAVANNGKYVNRVAGKLTGSTQVAGGDFFTTRQLDLSPMWKKVTPP